MKITATPVLLFTYKRVYSLKETVNALKNNYLANETDLYVFSDGAKNKEDHELVNEVRDFLKTIDGFKSVTIYEAEANKGLAQSIIDGVTSIIKVTERVIVMEDDLLTTPNFLDFMNAALDKYKNDRKVFSISGYSFDLKNDPNDSNMHTYFLNRGWSWGWATWYNRWENVDWGVTDYQSFKQNSSQRKAFAKGGSDLNGMLEKQMTRNLDSWAIRWFYSQFKEEGLTVYPKMSKVFNNGFDQFATHTIGSSRRYKPALDQELNINFNFPDEVKITKHYQNRFRKRMGVTSRIVSKLETLLIRFVK